MRKNSYKIFRYIQNILIVISFEQEHFTTWRCASKSAGRVTNIIEID